MAITYSYPSAFAMYEIAPDLQAIAAEGMVGLSLFPVENKDAYEVRWWQKDNAYGLMAMRGLEGRPSFVSRIGSNQYVYKPGVFGEFCTITEEEILTRATGGAAPNPNARIDLTSLVMDASNLLNQRQVTRKEADIWTLLTTGTISIPINGPAGQTIYSATFPVQTFTAAISWATTATATPIADLQTIQQKSVGHGSSFGPEATLYVNQITANNLINNSNAADLGGRRNMYGATLNSLPDISSYFKNQGLPGVSVYDNGYQNQQLVGPITNASTQFTKFIQNSVGVVVGARPGNQPLGRWHQVPSLNNPNQASGPYNYVKNYGLGINAPMETPAKLEVHVGFNGGLGLDFPSGICACSL